MSLSDSSGRVTASASSIINHSQYNDNTLVNDIALVRLSSSIATSSYISYISLGTATLASGVSVTVSGWGRTSDSSTGVSNALNYVTLTTITNTVCSSTYGSLNSGVVCATGAGTQSICSVRLK